MLLNNCELIPGVVQSVKDDEKLGRIKCIIPGVLDSSTMSIENMPWVYPFCMDGYQSFSKPIEGQKVWVLINKSNYNEYWYLNFFEYNAVTENYLQDVYDNDNPEVLVSRDLGGKFILDTYDDTNGFNRAIGENHLKMEPDGHVELLGADGKVQVNIDGNIVYCGQKDTEYESAVLGETLVSLLNKLQMEMSQLCAKSSSIYLSPLQIHFKNCSDILSKANQIKAEHCKVN